MKNTFYLFQGAFWIWIAEKLAWLSYNASVTLTIDRAIRSTSMPETFYGVTSVMFFVLGFGLIIYSIVSQLVDKK